MRAVFTFFAIIMTCIILIFTTSPIREDMYNNSQNVLRVEDNESIYSKKDDKKLMRKMNKDSWLFKKPLAHRGFHDIDSPENSITAFNNAVDMGYAIELDVQMLLDGNLIVFHDENIKRMTGIDKDVSDLIIEDLEDLKLKGSDEKIPLLKDVLRIVAGKVPLLVEIKNTSNIGKLEAVLISQLEDYRGEYAIQSFNPLSVKWIKDHSPNMIVGQVSGLHKDSNLKVTEKFVLSNLLFNFVSQPDFVNYEIAGLNKPIIKFLRFRGYPIISWTARDYDTYLNALQLSDNVIFEGFYLGKKK